MFAASGLVPNSLGEYDYCVHNYDMRYCILDAAGHALAQGLCLPIQCNEHELDVVISTVLSISKQQFEVFLNKTVKPIWDKACTNVTDKPKCMEKYDNFMKEATVTFLTLKQLSPSVKCGTHQQRDVTPGLIIMSFICVIIVCLAVAQGFFESKSLEVRLRIVLR